MVLNLYRMRNRILISAFADEKLSQEEDQVHDALPKTVVQHLVSRTIPNDDNSGYEYLNMPD